MEVDKKELKVVPAWGSAALQLQNGDFTDSGSSTEMSFFVFGAATEVEAVNAAYTNAPSEYEGIPKTSAEVTERLTEDAWKVNIAYGNSGSATVATEGGEVSVSFDCGGGTRHITNAISQKCLWRKEGVPFRDAKNLIGWNGKTGVDAVVSGVDVPFAQPRESYTKTMKIPLPTKQKRVMASYVGWVNREKWKGWEKGEVMFLGCTYSGIENKKAQVTFNFAIQVNENNVKIDDEVPPIKKEGHVFIWTQQRTVIKNGEPKIEVIAVYASQIAGYVNFSVFGLGK